MEMNSIEQIKNLTINSILKSDYINELYQNIMNDIISAASNGEHEITIDASSWDSIIRIKLKHIFKLLGYSVKCTSPVFETEIKLNISWL